MPTNSKLAQPNTQSQIDDDNASIDKDLAARCAKLLGSSVTDMAFPGGDSRDSVKIFLADGREAFASTRSRTARAENERCVLEAMAHANVNTPQLLASDSRRFLVQESIPGIRLTESLHDKKDRVIELRLNNALQSLSEIHEAGSAAGLDERMSTLGETRGWINGLLDRPAIIGDFFDVQAPAIDRDSLAEMLRLRRPRFVKWDARPGNAITRPDNEVFWIDWEHSGARNRLDDMVWLLADEWIPERPEIEQRLLSRHLEAYGDDLSPGDAENYFYSMGVFHLCVRMGLIFRYKKDGKWWNFQKCLAGDKVGVTRRNLRRICMRGERWAQNSPETQPLSAWFARMKTFAE